jgi:hypothetical protein
MRGLYEQQWQEAMSGATIQPSAGLWDNIANELDGERGRHNWVTILLIAATVTVAFAFPLTVGNSSLEVRESLIPNIAQMDNMSAPELSTDKNGGDTQDDNLTSSKADQNAQDNIAAVSGDANNTPAIIAKASDTEVAPIVGLDNSTNKYVASTDDISVSSSSATGYDMAAFYLDNSLMVVDINDYYFIPFFMSLNEKEDRSLLASLNMGTGSLSEGNGFGSLALMSADAALETSGNLQVPVQREEEPGSTYYFGAGIELPLGNRWSFLAGLGYLAQNANGTSNIVLDAGSGNQPLGAYDPVLPGTIFLSETYNYSVTNSYINVPLTIKYPIVNRKIKFRVGAGLSTDFMISHIVSSEQYGKASYNPASMEYRTVVLAGLVNLDISYSLNNQYSVAFETGIRKGFTAVDEGKDYYPSSFTVGLILFYKIK